ncbi:GNAT family N-acetyltransferase [Falsiroseomonas sp.]|uniref:GNAT family N-acetyltransferase n=1 Tax=Falsiroseomonas sp. TaxID=2870721 RepID=UPI0034A41C71
MRLAYPVCIARLAGLPVGFEELAADALADGHRVLEVLREDWDSGALRFERPGEALFAAYAGSALLGVCGVTPDPYVQDEQTGRMRRLYVRRAARRHGAGRDLLRAIAAEARGHGWVRLRLRAPPAAFAFYEACGFLRAVGEPAATHSFALGLSAPPGTP